MKIIIIIIHKFKPCLVEIQHKLILLCLGLPRRVETPWAFEVEEDKEIDVKSDEVGSTEGA